MPDTNTALALTDTSEELARWNGYLKSITAGMSPADAMQLHGILWREVESVVLSSPIESQRWREARLQGTASRFSLLDRDELFARIARGVPVETAVAEVRSGDAAQDVADLFELVEALPEWQERYEAAMRAKGLRDVQQIEEIADDDAKDIISGPKGDIPNMAAVSRAKLRVEARQWRLAKMDPKRFGDQSKTQVNVQIINHAEVLETARTRAKVRDKGVTRAQMAQVIEAAFKPVESAKQPAVEQPAETESNVCSCLEE
jgi:hypothetical protein